MTKLTEKSASPPYVSFKSFTNYADAIRELRHVPAVVDRGTMKTFSGSTQNELISALKFLKMTDDNSVPSQLFSDYALASNEDRKPILSKAIRDSYSFLFNNKTFNIERATENQTAELFREQGVNGSTNSRAIAFFLAAAKEAGITISPHVRAPAITRSASARPKKPKVPTPTAKENNDSVEDQEGTPPGSEILEIPIPINRKVRITLPSDFKDTDWNLFKTMLDAYIEGWKQEKKK